MQYLELPEQIRLSLVRGFVERSWRRPGVTAEEAACSEARIADERAHTDGMRLRSALDAVIAAGTFAELNAAELAYDDVAGELNLRYGSGLIVMSDEAEELGIRGFRGQGFATRSCVLVGEDLVAS
ncbi:hypothetical protein [Nocardioides gilvus]|uniref:hypothetical protein n=1 Tax=Nocardioides gilvus TaxID=1735589 RepID=UPI000D743744|nr:hypothetical protein [Nocardioides gilvus]